MRRRARCSALPPIGPWSVVDGEVVWRSARVDAAARFTTQGLVAETAGNVFRAPWMDVKALDISIPTTTAVAWSIMRVLSALGPKPFAYASRHVVLRVSDPRRDWAVDLGRADRFSWRLQLALDEALALMKKQEDFSPLARPDVLEFLADEVAPSYGFRAYLLRNVDLLGLDAKIGGRGSRDSVLQSLLDGDRHRR